MMTFYNINRIPQNHQNSVFKLDNFNKKFDDLMILSKIKTSETFVYQLPNDKTISIDSDLIDPVLANGKNYINPFKDDFIDPNQDSPDRISILALINKFDKKILVIEVNEPHHFFIPGGKNKIVESFKNSAIRNFKHLTNISLDKKKVYKLCCGENSKGLELCTFICFVFDEEQQKINTSHQNMKWIPIKYLYHYNNDQFQNYYRFIYQSILKNLY